MNYTLNFRGSNKVLWRTLGFSKRTIGSTNDTMVLWGS